MCEPDRSNALKAFRYRSSADDASRQGCMMEPLV